MQKAWQTVAGHAGGTITGGERQLADRYPDAWYARPAMADKAPA
ncbi:hypothetical protein CDEF62S_05026 [Castellaniella defragrans]